MKLKYVFSGILSAVLGLSLLTACGGDGGSGGGSGGGTGGGTGGGSETTTYSITKPTSDDYTVTAPSSAEEGDMITVTVTMTNGDKYLEGVTYNGDACSGLDGQDGAYTFTMPAENVTLAVQVGTYTEDLEDGIATFYSSNLTTIAKDSGEVSLTIGLNAPYTTALRTKKAVSSDQDVIPQDAIELEEVTNMQIVGASGSNEIDQVRVNIDTSKTELGSTWLTVELQSSNASSQRGTIVVKITVAEAIRVPTVKATIVFDLSGISDPASQYILRVWDNDYVQGSTLWDGQSWNDYLAAPQAADTVTFEIDYAIGHIYQIRLSRGTEDDFETTLLIEAKNEGGSSSAGYTQYTGDVPLTTGGAVTAGSGKLTFTESDTEIHLTVYED